MKIKICGITNDLDAHWAVESGADLIGFVFYKDSPRYVSPGQAREIIKKLPPQTVTVGVFVNETNQNMLTITQYCGLHTLQLHGQESIQQVIALKNRSLIKAFSPKTEQDLNPLQAFAGYPLLIDTPSNKYGGSGKTGNWELAKKVSSCFRIFLAGGLTCENVAQAISVVRPFGVDVSSGVEKSKGIKDPEKVRSFIKIVRQII